MSYDNKNITFDDAFKELKELYKNNLIDEDGYIKNLIEIQNKFKKTLGLIEYYPLLLNSKHPSWFTLLVGTEEQKKSIYKMYCDDLKELPFLSKFEKINNAVIQNLSTKQQKL